MLRSMRSPAGGWCSSPRFSCAASPPQRAGRRVWTRPSTCRRARQPRRASPQPRSHLPQHREHRRTHPGGREPATGWSPPVRKDQVYRTMTPCLPGGRRPPEHPKTTAAPVSRLQPMVRTHRRAAQRRHHPPASPPGLHRREAPDRQHLLGRPRPPGRHRRLRQRPPRRRDGCRGCRSGQRHQTPRTRPHGCMRGFSPTAPLRRGRREVKACRATRQRSGKRLPLPA